ncbi:MAG: hypothetical protein WAT22_02320 [Saprospiraceae bacterium]
MKIIQVTLYCLFSDSVIVRAQNLQQFKKVDLGNACDVSNTYGIIQDARQTIWIATDDGVIRYNAKDVFCYL